MFSIYKPGPKTPELYDLSKFLSLLYLKFLLCQMGIVTIVSTPDFPGGSDSKASAYNAGDPGSIPELGRYPGEGNATPLQYSLPGKSHGWRSLLGYSPWGRKESDRTEQLHLLTTPDREESINI